MIENVKDVKYFAKGKRGVVSVGSLKGVKVALKVKNPKSMAEGRVANEAIFLKLVNKSSIGPKFLAFEHDTLMYEFVEGEYLPEILPVLTKDQLKQVLRELLQQARVLDSLKISKGEMLRPFKNVVITSDFHAVLIDFERCIEKERPNNVTQFCQFLASEMMQEHYKRLEMRVPRTKVLMLAKDYKEDYSQKVFDKLLGMF